MLFNLGQKYASVFSTFVNTLLVLHFLGVTYLGLYAFLVASANIYAAITQIGLRSVYLREIVRDQDDVQRQRVMTRLTEVVPKLLAIPVTAVLLAGTDLFGLSIPDAISIAVIGCLLASAQLSGQKVRSHGYNTLSQLVVNIRPIVFMLSTATLGLMSVDVLRENFRYVIIASFAVPAIVAYTFWLVRFPGLVFGHVSLAELAARARTMAREMPGLSMLAFGQKALAQIDVVMVTAFLNLDAAGVYRACSQIVTVANGSMAPIASKYMKKYSRLLGEKKMDEARVMERKIASQATWLYILAMVIGVTLIYVGPFIENLRYREDFMWSLAILSVSGLLKSRIPMVDNYVVYRDNANKGGLILMGLVLATVLGYAVFIDLLGLPGACIITVLSVLSWRVIVKRFL